MTARSPLGRVDGVVVVVVDVVALRHLLKVTGPVEVDCIRYDADNVTDELLNRNNLRFPELSDRTERTDLHARVARAVFDAVHTRNVNATALAAALADAAKGRHLLLWSAGVELQQLWARVRGHRRASARRDMISAQNFDGNKLDYYLRPRADPTSSYIEGDDSERHRVFLDLQLPGPRLRHQCG